MNYCLLITTYNRPQYLRWCLASVRRAGTRNVFVYDDGSRDIETLQLISNSGYTYKIAAVRKGICAALLFGVEYLFAQGYDVVINLDADALVRNDYIERMTELHEAFPNDIITGFHSTTKNKDGSERHEITEQGFEDNVSFARKKSVGGINMLWTRENWQRMRPVIENAQARHLNWDHAVSLASGGIICAVPSLVQHIGIDSAMGHNAEQPDVAADFKTLSLPNVTLVCVDDDAQRGWRAIQKCINDIDFGDIKILSNRINPDYRINNCFQIPKLGSKEAYSRFIIRELHKYITTDYALIVQHDGYVKNPESWSNEFLQYDYIGATWWYKDGMNVGNGGFSLRSRRLLQLTAELSAFWTKTHPEDDTICRTYRKQLEQHGIKFAPESLATRFSFEGYNQPGTWNGQFGFHGNRAFRPQPNPRMTGFIINQFLGLGDILFLVPLIRYWMQCGHDIIWPIADEYFDIRRNFPDIQFVRKSDWPRVQYNSAKEHMHQWQYGLYQVKPLRWNTATALEQAMTTKYSMYGLDFGMWRGLYWERDYERERRLADLVGAHGDYALVFQEFGNVTDGGARVKVLQPETGLQKVYISKMQGFTLLDWSGIIERASEIHAVSSSCIYLFEMLNLRAEVVHLYSRRAGQKDFDMIKPLLKKEYKFYV